MRNLFTAALATILTELLPISTQAQIVPNGNFETQHITAAMTGPQLVVPTQRTNVFALTPTGGLNPYPDQLPSWRSNPSFGADYLATNASNSVVNPQGTPDYGTFTPRSGDGCVGLVRDPGQGSMYSSQYITQQVSLVSGRAYQVSFYVLRRPGAQWVEKMAAHISTGAPGTGTAYATVVSKPVRDHLNWTRVVGNFVAQGSSAYITVGYDQSQGTPDATLYSANPNGPEYYMVDDVAITDLCEAEIHPYTPRNFCYDQGNRYFGINYADPLLTYYWEIYALDPNTGTMTLRMSRTCTGTAPRVRVSGKQFQPGDYYARVRAVSSAPNSCTSEWVEMDFSVGEACSYDPNDDVPLTYRLPASSAAPDPLAAAYPNPATESLTIPKETSVIGLLNAQGKETQVTSRNGQLDVRSLPKGLYNLRLLHRGKVTTQRIQIEH